MLFSNLATLLHACDWILLQHFQRLGLRTSHSTSTLQNLTFSAADETSLRALPSQMAELRHRFPTWFPQPPMNVTADHLAILATHNEV